MIDIAAQNTVTQIKHLLSYLLNVIFEYSIKYHDTSAIQIFLGNVLFCTENFTYKNNYVQQEDIDNNFYKLNDEHCNCQSTKLQ